MLVKDVLEYQNPNAFMDPTRSFIPVDSPATCIRTEHSVSQHGAKKSTCQCPIWYQNGPLFFWEGEWMLRHSTMRKPMMTMAAFKQNIQDLAMKMSPSVHVKRR